MPWKERSVYEQRLSMVHQILDRRRPAKQVAAEYGVTRKTLHKWLRRYRNKQPEALQDHSRQPKHPPPWQTAAEVEDALVALRNQYHWGPRKLHRLLCDQRPDLHVPSIRTVATILARRGCLALKALIPPALPPQAFERAKPNELWQLDHMGPIEVARQRVTPLTVLDDGSRYCLCFARVPDLTMQQVWHVLWGLFEQVGLPDQILSDNAFSAPVGLSWFDQRLVRLDIQPLHGRPYHPQTQGKVERFHRTAEEELAIGFDAARRTTLEQFDADAEQFRIRYNTRRPHEALGDVPPITRWRPSTRLRPPVLPEISYPSGVITRRVSVGGDFRYHNARIVVGRALCHETVMIEQREQDIGVYYGWKLVRVIPHAMLGGPRSDRIV